MTETVQTRTAKKVGEGEVTSLAVRRDVGTGETVTLFLENLTSSESEIRIRGVELSAERQFNVNLHQNVTEDTAGSPVSDFEHYVGESDNVGSFNANIGGAYSDLNTDPFEELCPAESSKNILGSQSNASFILPPGTNVLLEATNESGNSSIVSISFEVSKVER